MFCSKIEIWWHSYFLNLDLLTQSPTLNRWFIAFQILLRVTVVEVIYTTGFKFKFSILTSQGYTTISWENQLLDHGSSRLTGDIVFTFWCTCSWIKPFLHTGLSWKSHFFKLPSNWVFKYSCNLAELIFPSPRYKYLFSVCLLYIPYLFSPVSNETVFLGWYFITSTTKFYISIFPLFSIVRGSPWFSLKADFNGGLFKH